jgi:uncharacterized protein (TIGR04376 family)
MGLFDFLEKRLEEFLENNPHLELQALEEQIYEQKQDTIRLINQLESTLTRLQDEILAVAKEIQTWHSRITKAQNAGRLDLAHAAQEREAALLRQGNQLWGQMEASKLQITQSKELLVKIEKKQKEIKAKKEEIKASQTQFNQPNNQSSWDTNGWNQGYKYQTSKPSYDDLDAKFQQWEMDEEIEQMKRKMGK